MGGGLVERTDLPVGVVGCRKEGKEPDRRARHEIHEIGERGETCKTECGESKECATLSNPYWKSTGTG